MRGAVRRAFEHSNWTCASGDTISVELLFDWGGRDNLQCSTRTAGLERGYPDAL